MCVSIADDVLIETVAASGTGVSLHTYSSKSRVFTWNCGLVVPSAAGGGKGKLTLEATVMVSSPQPQGSYVRIWIHVCTAPSYGTMASPFV